MSYRLVFGLTNKALLPVLIFAVLVSGFAHRSSAEELTSGTSSRSARQKALQSIPFHELNEATQRKIQPVLNRPSIYRRLPITQIEIDPDYFVFLARYPEVIVNIWKIMGVTKMTTTRTGPFTIRTNDGVGTISNVELVYGTKNQHIFYGDGTYEGPVLKRKLRGECVLVLNTNYSETANGQPIATSQLDVFLKIENATAGLVAKTLNPIVGSTADHNFVESLHFLQRLNETTTQNGVGVQRMANRLTDINNDTRQQFVKVAGDVFERAGGKPDRAAPAAPSNYGIPAYTRPTSYPNTTPRSLNNKLGSTAQPYPYAQNSPQAYPAQQTGYYPTQGQPAGYPRAAYPNQAYQSAAPNQANYYQPRFHSAPVQQTPASYRPTGNRPMPANGFRAPAYPQSNLYQR